jgi:hypothetical protein
MVTAVPKFEIPSAADRMEPVYLVFFRSGVSNGQKYEPVVSLGVMASQIAKRQGTFPHLFDGDLIPALPLLLYVIGHSSIRHSK